MALATTASMMRTAKMAGPSVKKTTASRRVSRVVARAAEAETTTESPTQPPTVSDTKRGFLEGYGKPIPAMYNNVIQELLVQQHFLRYNVNYSYDSVTALGFLTVFEQLMDGYRDEAERAKVLDAYVGALNQDAAEYKASAAALEDWAKDQTAESLVNFADASGAIPTEFKSIAEKAKSGKGFQYSKFFGVGMFRLLELTAASDPTTLEKLCDAFGVKKVAVDKDLDMYRSLLGKLTAAKEMMAEFLAREKKKREERAAAKSGAAASETSSEATTNVDAGTASA